MPLTVGTNTYIDDEDAESYCDAFGLDVLTDPETSLVQATVALDRLYGGKFIGKKASPSQALCWPRFVESGMDQHGETRDFTYIPEEVAEATVEIAVMLEAGEVNVYAQPEPVVKSRSSKVDVISESVEYVAGGFSTQALYKINLLLAALTTTALTTVRLTRG